MLHIATASILVDRGLKDRDGAITWDEWRNAVRANGVGFGAGESSVYLMKPRPKEPAKKKKWIAGVSG